MNTSSLRFSGAAATHSASSLPTMSSLKYSAAQSRWRQPQSRAFLLCEGHEGVKGVLRKGCEGCEGCEGVKGVSCEGCGCVKSVPQSQSRV
eukprot:216552-Pelagomonas_calceolata.AAC.5